MVDFSKSMLGAREDEFVSVWMGDFADLKLVTKRDLVICAGGLEFFDAPTSFFASAFLNTRDDGKLLVLYPPWSISGLIYALHHFFNGIRIRLFSKSKIDRHATQSGWKIQARANAHPFATVALYAK